MTGTFLLQLLALLVEDPRTREAEIWPEQNRTVRMSGDVKLMLDSD
jgi:hypothetical protein